MREIKDDKQMERYSMFLDRKNQYCEMTTTKCNLQIQCYPYQSTNGIFHRTRTKKLIIHILVSFQSYSFLNQRVRAELKLVSGAATAAKSL